MEAGLLVVDLETLPELSAASRCLLQESTESIALSGDHAYLGLTTGEVAIVDISNPSLPRVNLKLDGNGKVCGLTCVNGFLFVTSGASSEHRAELRIFDISNPTSPSVVSKLESPELPGFSRPRIKVIFPHAYIAANDLWIVDITDLSSPTTAAVQTTPHIAVDVDATTDYVYVADASENVPAWRSALIVVDVSYPSSPVTTASYSYFGDVSRVRVRAQTAFIAALDLGLAIFDCSDPTVPQPQSCYRPAHRVTNVALTDDRVVIGQQVSTSNEYGNFNIPICEDEIVSTTELDSALLLLLDITDTANPEPLGCIRHPGHSAKVVLQGDYAYVGDVFGQLTIIDISRPEKIAKVSSINLPRNDILKWELQVKVQGDSVYVALGPRGLAIVDVSDRTDPRLAAVYDSLGWAADIAFRGGYAYYAAAANGLQVLDLSRPDGPQVVASVDTPDWAICVELAGGYAFVGARFAGLQVVDISDPRSPVLVSSFTGSGNILVHSLATTHGLAILGSGGKSLQVIDVSDPCHPERACYIHTSGSVFDLATQGELLFAANVEGGWQVFDLEDVGSIQEVAAVSTPGWVTGIDVAEELVGVADNSSFLLYRLDSDQEVLSPPTFCILHANYPNPFNTSTIISYDIDMPGHVELTVFNVLGQEVVTLVNSIKQPGRYELEWDSKDRMGRDVASGVYLAKLTAGESNQTIKMILLK